MAAWTADNYTDGQNWTSSTGGIVATRAGAGSPTAVNGAFLSHKGVELDGTSYFTVPAANNPLAGATQFTLVAVFEPNGTGPTGDYWWQSSGLIGMEQNFANTDWGLGWNGDRVTGGVGGPDTTTFSSPVVSTAPQVAVYTWNNGTQRLFVNGTLVDTDYFIGNVPRNSGNFALGAMTDGGAGTFSGRIAELRIYNTDESASAVTISSALRSSYIAPLEYVSSKLTITGGSVTVRDTTSAISAAGTHVLFLNGEEIPAASITRGKAGDLTTLSFPATLTGNTAYTIDLTVPLQGGGSQGLLATSYTPRLPATIPGIAGSVGTWGISETVSPTTGAPNDIATSVALVTGPTPPAPVTASAPVFNHSDPDTNDAGSSGNFNNDFPLISNTAADDAFVVVGKTQVSIPAAGIYTFNIHSDDGFALRVTGASGGRFISNSGEAQIDRGDSQTIYRDGGTGDSNSRGAYQFDAAGTYDIIYLGYDGGSGAFYELAWAPGAFNADRDTNTWALVGNPNAPGIPAYRDRWVANLPGPAGTVNSFGMRTYRDAGTINGLNDASNFLASTTRQPGDGVTTDAQVPYINHRDPNDGGGGGSIPGDLPFPGNTNNTEDNVVTVAKGRLSIATSGTYTFWAQGDDGFLLRIKGVNGNPNPSFRRATQGDFNGATGKFQMSHTNELFFADGTGNSNTRGIIDLTAGTYDIDYIHVEQTGGFYHELTAAAGEWPHGTEPPAGFQLVGFVPPSSSVLVPGIAEPGWTVETGQVGAYPNNIAGAETRINDTLANPGAPANKTSVWDKLDFYDPQDGTQGSFPNSNPWPFNTDQAENDFSIRATGILNVTQAGEYQLGFQGDDGGYLYIYGVGGNPDPVISSIVATNFPNDAAIGQAPGSIVNNAIRVDRDAGNSHTVVSVPLNVGQYRIQTLIFEIGGGFFWEVFGAKGPLDPSFVHPLLAKGSGSTVSVASGLPLVVQGAVTPPDSNFKITNLVTAKGPPTTAQFSFGSQPGATYSIEASTNLGIWTTVQASVPSAGATTPVSLNLSAFPGLNGQNKVYFRVRQN